MLFILLILKISNAQNNISNDTLVYNLMPITVTATRYSEKIVEIPYAVSVISKDEFNYSKSLGLDELVKNVPGVLAQSRSGNYDVRLVIRGFGARGAGDRSNYGTTRGIKVLINGIPETEPDGRTSFDLVELSSVQKLEVIRSNSSAIWGNASGGVINLSTFPDEENSFNKIDFINGSFGLNKIVASSFLTNDKNKFYTLFSNSKLNGWREHSSNYRTLVNLNYSSNYDDSKIAVYLSATSNVIHIPGPLTKKQFENNPQQANNFYKNRDERRHNRLGKLSVTYDYFLDSSNSISSMVFVSPKYLQRSERGTFRDFNRYYVGGSFIYKNETDFGELYKNHFVAGFDEAYQDGAILFYSLSSSNFRGNQLRDNKREGANNFGIFVQDEIIFNDKISLLAGLRYDNIKYYSENYLNNDLGLQEKSFSKLIPKIGISYRFTQSFSIYANIGGGLEVPAGNETDPSNTFGEDKIYLINPLLEPIISTSYETGLKQFILLDNEDLIKSLSYSLALYFINIKNDIIPYKSGRFYFSAGKTNRKGLEFGLNIQTKFNLEFLSSFTLSNNLYKNYLVDSIHYGKPNKFADYSGNYVAGIPNYFYNLELNYFNKKLFGLFLNLNLQGVSNYFVDDANILQVPSYYILNLSFGSKENFYFASNIKCNVSFAINNIFNKKYVSSAYINPDIINNEPYYLEPGLPRNFSLNISLTF